MRVELITTGSELLLGRVLNSHQQWLGRKLDDHGWTVERQMTVADNGPAIEAAVREGLTRADLVITTGGLGPTADDITRDRIASMLGRGLVEDTSVRDRITSFFQRIQRSMPDSVLVQAQVPEGAIVLQNAHGTAPGLFLELLPNPFADGPAWLLMLPGPPRELRPMFAEQAIPLLLEKCPPPASVTTLILKVAGMGESMVEEKIAEPLEDLLRTGLEVGYCSRSGEVDVRLRAPNAALVSQADAIVRAAIGKHIFGVNEETLEQHIIHSLSKRGETLVVAESCTGGFITNRLTNVPGASTAFLAGLITYSNDAKQIVLGVKEETLATCGAVSEEIAREMAEGARARHDSTYALATTGIAGPTGATEEKPLGTVYIALAAPSGTCILNPCNAVDRETFKFVTSQQALDLLRKSFQ